MTGNRRKILIFALFDHCPEKTIAKRCRISRARVSQIINELRDGGYLIKTSKKGQTATFSPGINLSDELLRALNSASEEKTVGTVGDGSKPPNLMLGGPAPPDWIPEEYHNLGFIFRVRRKPEKAIPGKISAASTVPQYVFQLNINYDPEADPRNCTCIYRDGKTRQSLTVWLPELLVTSPQIIHEIRERAAGTAQNIANWFMWEFDCELGVIELAANPHAVINVPKGVVQAFKGKGFNSPFLRGDNSRGRNHLETDSDEVAEFLMTAPARFAVLERSRDETNALMKALVDSHVKNNELLTALSKNQVEMNDLLRKVLISTTTDPGGMFG